MKNKDSKPASPSDKSSRVVPLGFMFVVLCGLSFYLGGIFCSEKDRFLTKDITKEIVSPKRTADASSGPLHVESVAFPECSIDFQDYTPCTDPKVLFERLIS